MNFKKIGNLLNIRIQILSLVIGLCAISTSHAQYTVILDSFDDINGTPLKVEYRVESTKNKKSYTIQNEDGVSFITLKEDDEVRIRVFIENYYPEEHFVNANELDTEEVSVRFPLRKMPSAELTFKAINMQTGKTEPASFELYNEGRMVGRGNTTRNFETYTTTVSKGGEYTIKVTAPGFTDKQELFVTEIGTPAHKITKEIKIEKAAQEIAVRVLDEQTGNPVKSSIKIENVANGEVLHASTALNGMTLFLFENGKSYKITAEAESYKAVEKVVQGAQREDLKVFLRPETSVTFTAIDALTERPIDATFEVIAPSGKKITLLENGKSFLPTEKGKYAVTVSSNGYLTKNGSVSVNSFTGGKIDFSFALDEADKQYHITVLDFYSKEIVKDADLRVYGPNSTKLEGIKPDKSYLWEFSTDPQKKYFIEVDAEGYVDYTQMLKEDQKTIEVLLKWKPEVTYKLRVLDKTLKTPIQQSTMGVLNSAGKDVFVYKTETAGEFLVKQDKNQTFSYMISAKGYKNDGFSITSKPNNVQEFLLERNDSQEIQISILDELTGKPLDATVTYLLNGQKLDITKKAPGKYVANFSQGGTYVLDAKLEDYTNYNTEINAGMLNGDVLKIGLKKAFYNVQVAVDNLSSNQEIRAAQFVLTDASGNRIPETFSAGNGRFVVKLLPNITYSLALKKDGYNDYTDTFELKDLLASDLVKHVTLEKPEVRGPIEEAKPVATEAPKPPKAEPKPKAKEEPLETQAIDIPKGTEALSAELNKKESIGKRYVLAEVFFDQSSAQIRDTEVPQLNDLAATLIKNPNMRIEIIGYTDNVGDMRLNLGLSKNRAKAVSNYLFNKGADPFRIKTNGFGQKKAVAPNDTEENRAKNRRVELVLIEN